MVKRNPWEVKAVYTPIDIVIPEQYRFTPEKSEKLTDQPLPKKTSPEAIKEPPIKEV